MREFQSSLFHLLYVIRIHSLQHLCITHSFRTHAILYQHSNIPLEYDENLTRASRSNTDGDLNTLELGAFELPPSWKDANTMVEELKAKYVYVYVSRTRFLQQ